MHLDCTFRLPIVLKAKLILFGTPDAHCFNKTCENDYIYECGMQNHLLCLGYETLQAKDEVINFYIKMEGQKHE